MNKAQEKNANLNKQEFKERKEILESFPDQLNIELNTVCNSKCAFCYAHTLSPNFNRIKPDLSVLDDLAPYIEAASGLAFQGNSEPSVDPCFIQAAKLAENKRLAICTNAIDISRIKPILTSHRGSLFIRISLEAFSKDTYHYLMGVDNFEKTIENIKWLANLHTINKNCEISKLSLSAILFKSNLNEIFDMVKFADEQGFGEFELRLPIFSLMYKFDTVYRAGKPFNYLDQYPSGVVEEYRDQYKKIMAYLAEKKSTLTLDIVNPDDIKPMPRSALMLNKIISLFVRFINLDFIRFAGNKVRDVGLLFFNEDLPIICDQPWRFSLLFQNGNIRPCCPSSYSLGNFKKAPFPAVWNGWRLRRMRRLMAQGKTPFVCRLNHCPVYRQAKASHSK